MTGMCQRAGLSNMPFRNKSFVSLTVLNLLRLWLLDLRQATYSDFVPLYLGGHKEIFKAQGRLETHQVKVLQNDETARRQAGSCDPGGGVYGASSG
jgi:hypothetical protein